MGSPVSPVVADIIMEHCLDECVQQLREKHRFLTKYVDDLFAIVKIDNIDETLEILNNFHKDIQFTMEKEKNGQLPYLDTLLIRTDNTVKLDWYQKPMASGRIINFLSKHPKNIIYNTASNFINRVLQISDKIYHHKNKVKIREILKNNNFPITLINKMIDRQITKENNITEKKDTPVYKSMTYTPILSEHLHRSKILDERKYRMTFKTNNTLSKKFFTNMKTKIDKLEKSNVIYRIECSGNSKDTCNKVYIGTTKSKLKTRISAHKSNIKLLDNRNSIQKTALATHCAQNKHVPDFNNVSIVDEENNYNKRFTLEMLHIVNTPTQIRLNYKTDSDNCSQSYRHLITKNRSVRK